MNEQAAAALVSAALRGVRQIMGALFDGAGGMCAGAVLMTAAAKTQKWDAEVDRVWAGMDKPASCPHDCGFSALYEWTVMVHMNDVHGDDFLTIARKLGP